MSEQCDICYASKEFQPLLEISLGGLFAVWIHECKQCGFRQVRPRLSQRDLTIIYLDEYFSPTAEIGFRDYYRQAQRYERVAYFLAKRVRRLVRPKGRILDVGCALGFLLQALRRYTQMNVQGIDISPFATNFARKKYQLDVECGVLEDMEFPAEYFDFIIQKDLLEHVINPRIHLLESHRILKSGGYIWLTTPNGEINLRPLFLLTKQKKKLQKDELPLFDQGHLSFFTKGHLLRLFSECGFECVHMRNISIRRGLGHLGILPWKKKPDKTILRSNIPLHKGVDDERTSRSETNSTFNELYAQITEQIEKRNNPIRSWLPYFYQRQIVQWLDTLPASFTIGLDFEFLIRKI